MRIRILVLCAAVLSLLAACGDSTATTAPVATKAAATVAATTAPVATTAPAATTAAMAATTAPVAAGTTAPASTGTMAPAVSLPTITNATEVQLAPDLAKVIASSLAKSAPDATAQLFVSNDDLKTFVTNVNTAFTGAGYTYGIPGQTGPSQQGTGYLAVYVKPGSPDILIGLDLVPTDTATMTNGLDSLVSAAALQSYVQQLTGKKSAAFIATGTGLAAVAAAAAAANSATPAAGATTAPAMGATTAPAMDTTPTPAS